MVSQHSLFITHHLSLCTIHYFYLQLNTPSQNGISTAEPASVSPAPEALDVKRLYYRFIGLWFFFVLSVVVALASVFIYLRYAQPVYRNEAVILLKEEETDRRLLENLLENLDGYSQAKRNLENEIAIINSPSMVRQAIDSLGFKVSVFLEGNVRSTEAYHLSPIVVEVDSLPEEYYGQAIYVRPDLKGQTFTLELEGENTGFDPDRQNFTNQGTGAELRFGRTYFIDGVYFRIYYRPENRSFFDETKQQLYFTFNKPERLTDELQTRLDVSQFSDNATLLVLAAEGEVPEKECDFINAVVRNYVRRGLEEKNIMAQNTIKFIDDQLTGISTRLQDAEGELKRFRTQNKVMDLTTASKYSFEKLDALEAERANVQVKRQYYIYLRDYLRGGRRLNQVVAPSSIGIEDPLLNQLISRLSGLYSERSTLQLSAQRGNPALASLDDRINVARQELEENVRNIIANSDITMADINKRAAQAERDVVKLPETERALVSLQRRFAFNDQIYTYLMQKRAEAGMALAANQTDTRVVEPAEPRKAILIAPKRLTLYSLALTLGLAIPAVLIFLSEVFNDRIRSRDELEQITRIPIVGMVGHSRQQGSLVVTQNLKAVITEAFRTIRLNLNYFVPEKEAHVIGITSSVSGEGKTFTSINLAGISALAGKRTVLLMADMRKPKFENDLGINHEIGLSTFLSRQADLGGIIQPSRLERLDVISSGPVPPNPAELTGSDRMRNLLAELRQQYDVVIVDTPPLGLVSDFYQVAELMDINLYIVRHNYTRRSFLGKINEYHRQGKIRNLCLVINDVSGPSGGYGYGYGETYGYGYGYGYGEGYFSEEPKGWFGKLFKKV